MTIRVGDTIVITQTKGRWPHLTIGKKYKIIKCVGTIPCVINDSGINWGIFPRFYGYKLVPKTFKDEIRYKILSGSIRNV